MENIEASVQLERLCNAVSKWKGLKQGGCGKIPALSIYEFAGAIGSGKSETERKLQEMFEESGVLEYCKGVMSFDFIYEDIDSSETKAAIRNFYAGKSDSVKLENTICGTRIKNMADAIERAISNAGNAAHHAIVSDRSLIEDIPFIESLIKAEKSGKKKASLRQIMDAVKQACAAIEGDVEKSIDRLIINLTPGITASHVRMQKRGRPEEQSLTRDDIRALSLTAEQLSRHAKSVMRVNNKYLEADEVATALFDDMLSTFRRAYGEKDVPHYRMLVSLYGMPGVGKTYLLDAIKEIAAGGFNEFINVFGFVADGSDDAYIMERQKERYTKDPKALSPDGIQEIIDRRRLEKFEKYGKPEWKLITPRITITDIGPETSSIFRDVTKAVKSDTYKSQLEGLFNALANVIIVSGKQDLDDVLSHIAERGRPGEEEGLTKKYLLDVHGQIVKHVLNAGREPLILTNRYTKQCTMSMVTFVLSLIRDEIIRYIREWGKGR